MKFIHFVGIGGIGLSALARYLKKQGFEISGSDIKETKITKCLREEGIEVCIPHSEKNITNQDLVIYSAAIKDDNVELLEARKKGIVTLSRKDALPFILKEKRVFSVCGAHGKSTTSAILASMVDGSVIIGAESKQYGSNMHYKESNNVIFEADESDSSFLNSNPYIAIVTNAEPEHMEYYNYDYEKFYDAYRLFLQSATIRVINAEDEFLATLDNLEAIRLYPSRDITELKTIIKNGEPFTSFVLKDLGRFEVWGIGYHIAVDASLAILAAINEIDLETTREKIKNFRGIKKRFDILTKSNGYALIDDYGHHPTEIKATIASAQKYAALLGIDKITAIWQPHKYSRTVDNLKGFVECFEGVDELIILPVWSAGESKRDIDFAKEFGRYNPKFVNQIKRVGEFINLDESEKSLQEGLIIGFGAGDITYQLRGA
ncbi:MAG TPA: UDP-N-acetylmuramate--L-alanine ligase [Sulfurospirillum sp. UBA12182]|jgi:UDP-N-acetylmuramate--alanine ligase|nr:MAG TPA: UDP-N-acetylmuramate--L-alanine ligase [Sulfurospirillum sp. UBA12182]